MKAYDLKELEVKLKEAGLPVVEDLAEKSVKAVFEWLKESAVASESEIDDFLSMLYPKIEARIQEKIDKISE